MIDAVGVPEIEDSPLDDLDLYFRKTLIEADSKWDLSTTAKQVIDTKPWRGNVQKCMPGHGRFSFVHIDFNGEGGIAHMIEDSSKFTKYKALETLASGPLGIVIVNLKQALSKKTSLDMTKQLKTAFN